jgi:hypothetical protein
MKYESVTPATSSSCGWKPSDEREESRMEDLMAVNNHKPYTRGRA